MIMDLSLVFDSALALTATAASTNYIDTGAAGDALPPGLVAQVQFLINTTVAATGGASTTTFKLQTATDAAFSSPIDLCISVDTPKATLVAGYVIQMVIPPGALRYLRAYYVVSTNNWTSGKVDARIILTNAKLIDGTMK